MIEDKDIEKTLDWLVHESKQAAEARANRVYLEEGRKALKAVLMKQSGEETVSAQEREAYSHPDYKRHLEGLREAVFRDERYRWLLTTAEAKISAWQTMSRMARTQEQIK